MNNITVGISADVAELETKLALAQASLRAFSAEAKNLANQAVAGGGAVKSGLLPQLEASATSAAAARAQVATLRGEIAATGGAAASAGLPFATLTRELRALGTEISRGEILRGGGTIALLGEHMLELGPAILSAVAGVAAFAGGLAYLAIEAARTQKAVDDIQSSMILVGRGAEFSSEGASTAIRQLASEFDISRSAAAQLAGEFAKVPLAADATRSALGPLALALASVSGETPAKAAEQLAKAFAGGASSALQFGDAIRLFTPEQKLALEDAGKHNDVLKAQGVLLDALNARLGAEVQYLKDVVTQEQRASQQLALAGESPILNPVEQAPSRPGGGSAPSAAALQALDVATRYRGVQDDIARVKGDIAILDKSIATTEAGPLLDAEVRARAQAQKQLEELQAQGQASILDQDRTQLAKELALSTEGHAEQAAAAVAFWQRMLATQRLSAKEREAVELELAKVQKQVQSDQLAYNLQTNAQQERTTAATFATEEAQIRADFAEKKVTADQEYALLVDLEAKKTKAVVAGLQEREALLTGDAARQSAVESEILLAYEKQKQEMIRIDQQYFEEKKKLEDQDSANWKNMTKEILSAEDSLVSGLFNAHQKLTTSLINLGAQLLQRELANDLKALTERVLVNSGMLASDKATETGGLLWHLATEQTKTEATVTGAAARQAAESSSTGLGLANMAESAIKWILNDSLKVFSGIFGFLAPEMGPAAVGPATAGEVLVAATAGGVLSAAGGAWNLPGGLVMTHPQESILPADISGKMRDFFSGGGSAGGVVVNLNVNAVDGRSVKAFFKQNMPALSSSIASAVRDGSTQFRGIAPR